MKSLAQQYHSMKRNWPGFEFAQMGDCHVVWFGELIGVQKPYRVMVEYGMLINPKVDPLYRHFPLVRILSPRLRPNFDAAEEAPLPDVYFDREDLSNSVLCLFDPAAGEWSYNDFSSLTTVPWACDWLASYEGWRATGRWFGGGRHAKPHFDQVAS